MSSYKEITRALSTQLSTLSGGWDIAWPNLEYEPVVGTSYLRLSFLPALTEQADLGTAGMNNNLGIAQIDIFDETENHEGWGVIYEKADQIAEHFRRGTKLVNGGITVTIESVDIGPMFNEGGWLQMPVSVNYRSYTPN